MAWIAEERSVLLCARQMVWQSHVRSLQEAERHQAGPGRWHRDDGGGGTGRRGDGDRNSAGVVPDSAGKGSSTGHSADSASDQPTIDGGRIHNVAQMQDAAGAGQSCGWLPDASSWDDDEGGSAAHHAIHTPFLTDKELCGAQS